MEPSPRRAREERQQRLKETVLDLANRFVEVRMKFLRHTGAQPPEVTPRLNGSQDL